MLSDEFKHNVQEINRKENLLYKDLKKIYYLTHKKVDNIK